MAFVFFSFRFNYKETFEGADRGALLLCADYHQKTHMLVAGFSNGHFYLHEMPDFNLIHSLRYIKPSFHYFFLMNLRAFAVLAIKNK